MDTLSGETTVKIVLASLLKRGLSKMKEFAPHGSKFFPFRVDPFSQGTWCAESQTGSHKNCLPCKNGGNSTGRKNISSLVLLTFANSDAFSQLTV